MDQPPFFLTPEFWKAVGASIMSAPLVNIPLLMMAGIAGWWLRGREDRGTIGGLEERLKGRDDQLSGQIRGLEERLRARDDQLSARDERLKFAEERYKDLADKLAIVTQASLALQKEVTRYAQAHRRFEGPTEKPMEFRQDLEVEVGEPGAFIKSLQFSVDRTVKAVESANSSSQALGQTLDVGQTLGRTLTDYVVVPPEPSTTPKSG
jgi:hypothetical protein